MGSGFAIPVYSCSTVSLRLQSDALVGECSCVLISLSQSGLRKRPLGHGHLSGRGSWSMYGRIHLLSQCSFQLHVLVRNMQENSQFWFSCGLLWVCLPVNRQDATETNPLLMPPSCSQPPFVGFPVLLAFAFPKRNPRPILR